MSLATKLVTLRKDKGLTQMELAEQLNVSRQAVSRWEVGAAVPSIDNLKVLSNLYSIPIGYLLDETTDNITTDSELQEHSSNKSNPQVNKTTHRFTYLILIALMLIVTFVVCYLVVPRPSEEDPVPMSQMDEDAEGDYTTYTFTIE